MILSSKTVLTEYTIRSPKIARPLSIALAADLHSRDPHEALDLLALAGPDLAVVAGDLLDHPWDDTANACAFLKGAARICPTFYTMGNHEFDGKTVDSMDCESLGVVRLENRSVEVCGISLGGYSDFAGGLDFARAFSEGPGFKALICHRPELYKKELADLDIDLILSGHAHGGQIRVFNRGMYAPGQGVFAKYVFGVYDGRLVVSRGLANSVPVPRLFNPTELVIVDLLPENE
ncbi:MAG: metallophosphoesterase [Clostridia bacterium]|nr:metallophosphoesterase [Clostridia bacterium]